MKYLYYSLYLFYVKVIQLHKQYPPIINITAVMAVLFNFILFSAIKIYFYEVGYVNYSYSILLQIALSFILWKILYEYYKPKETKLLEEMKKKPLWLKVFIVILSLGFIIIVVKLWMFDGSVELYEFYKHNKLEG